MSLISNNFVSIRNTIISLQKPTSASFFSPFWQSSPLRTLSNLSTELQNKVSTAIAQANQTQDQKSKYAICKELVEVNRLLQEVSKQKGTLNNLIKESLPIRQEIDKMQAIVNNALVRGNNVQKTWSTQFCPEEAFLDSQWEQLMESPHHLPIEPVGFFKYYFLFLASLIWTQLATTFSSNNWYDQITLPTSPGGGKLYLGGLPVKTPLNNHLDQLKKEGIDTVLSMTEPFENNLKGLISSAVTPAEWEDAGVKQLQIPMEDWNTGSIEDVERGVEFIRWNLMNNRSIYVHCKAGRGRSALVVLAYLIKYENLSVDEAFTRMRSTRPRAGFKKSDPKWKTLQTYAARCGG